MTADELTHPNLTWYNGNDANMFMASVSAHLLPARRVLDLGCGILPEPYLRPSDLHILAEPCAEYIAILRDRFATDPHYLILQGEAQKVLSTFADRSVDTVFLLDVIEHLPKDEGQALVGEMERVARQQVVIFTCIGEYPHVGDVWGYHAHTWQTHRSSWYPSDFDYSWKILACEHFHPSNGAMYAIKTKYATPEIAYHLSLSTQKSQGPQLARRFGDDLHALMTLPIKAAVKVWSLLERKK